jgi:hypothetical protein
LVVRDMDDVKSKEIEQRAKEAVEVVESDDQ